MMTLSKLVKVLSGVAGSGHPAVLVTPDGKCWEVKQVVSTQTFYEGGGDHLLTRIELVPNTPKVEDIL